MNKMTPKKLPKPSREDLIMAEIKKEALKWDDLEDFLPILMKKLRLAVKRGLKK